MRIIRNKRHRSLDELNGVLSPQPIIPTISRRSKRGVFGGLVTRCEPMSFGYVSWMAFLVFWMVFARAYVNYEMTTKVFSATSGVLISTVAKDDLRDTNDIATYRVGIGPQGELVIDGQNWKAFSKSNLCQQHPVSHNLPLVIVALSPNDTYQSMVGVVERVLVSASPYGCAPHIETEISGGDG